MIKVKLQKRNKNTDLYNACSVIQNAWDNLILNIAKSFKLDELLDYISKKIVNPK